MSTPVCMYYFREWDCKLLASLETIRTPHAEIMEQTNGCGRSGMEERLIPDTMYGLDISPACRVHDMDYIQAKARATKRLAREMPESIVQEMLTSEENEADGRLGLNLKQIIKTKSKSTLLLYLRLKRSDKYCNAVYMTDVLNALDVACLDELPVWNHLEVAAC